MVATPFTGDDRLINAASGDSVGLARGNTSEAFIMTKIKVGFRPVVSHIDFTMLIGRHRARIDVQIGIELPNAHTITPRLQQCCKACRHKALAKRGNRSEEHTSELQSLMRISYAVFCLKKKTKINQSM